MNRTITIWGRVFNLKVLFDVYEGEEILDSQKEALEYFVRDAEKLFESYQELESYCIRINTDDIVSPIENIFKYVMPETIYVKRNNRKRVVVLLCNYRFDEEHGVALTYENEKLKHIGTQDDI